MIEPNLSFGELDAGGDMTLRDVLDKRKADEKPLPHGPRKGRPWGRLHRRLFREDGALPPPGPYYGEQLHYKNAAARRKYRQGLDTIMATGVEGEALQMAVEDLQRHFCKRVTIYEGLNRRVRRQLRSEMMREDRKYAAEHGSGDSEGASPDDPASTDTGEAPVLDT